MWVWVIVCECVRVFASLSQLVCIARVHCSCARPSWGFISHRMGVCEHLRSGFALRCGKCERTFPCHFCHAAEATDCASSLGGQLPLDETGAEKALSNDGQEGSDRSSSETPDSVVSDCTLYVVCDVCRAETSVSDFIGDCFRRFPARTRDVEAGENGADEADIESGNETVDKSTRSATEEPNGVQNRVYCKSCENVLAEYSCRRCLLVHSDSTISHCEHCTFCHVTKFGDYAVKYCITCCGCHTTASPGERGKEGSQTAQKCLQQTALSECVICLEPLTTPLHACEAKAVGDRGGRRDVDSFKKSPAVAGTLLLRCGHAFHECCFSRNTFFRLFEGGLSQGRRTGNDAGAGVPIRSHAQAGAGDASNGEAVNLATRTPLTPLFANLRKRSFECPICAAAIVSPAMR